MKTLVNFFLLFMTVKLAQLCVNANIPIHSQCDKDDQLALLQFKKKSLVFDNYASPKAMSWNTSTDQCCSWAGVTCSNGQVVGLDISGEFLSGGIDNSSSLFHLQHLQSLNMSYNCQIGDGTHIPSAIGKLTNLRYLNLSGSCYTGQIPVEISRLTKLVILDLSGNVLGGNQLKLKKPNLSTLVKSLAEITELYLDDVTISTWEANWSQALSSSLPNLRVLSLSACNLSGPIDHSLSKLQSLSVIRLDDNAIPAPVPGVLSSLTNLTFLSLRSCMMHGTFPKETFQNFPRMDLQSLVLSRTNFSGFLPDSIGNLKMLSMIDLSGCRFTGSIPKSIQNLTQLVHLSMSSNRFSGPIDSIHWENLVNLLNIALDSNLLHGRVPSSIFCPPLLEELLLSNNHFSGPLHKFSNVSSNLVKIDLSFNNLERSVPVSIFDFRGLDILYLSSNNFSAFPFNGPQLSNVSAIDLSYNNLLVLYNGANSSYSSFPQIVALRLASNNLTTFPDFLRNHTYLTLLDLPENKIQGIIPNWIWGLISLSSLNLSCNSFVTLEVPLPNDSGLSELDLHSNQLQGQIPIFLPFSRYLDYSKNNFSSGIPSNIGDFLTETRFFSLSSNNLHGPIPVSMCNGSFEFLDMSNNSLSGTIPPCLTARMSLSILILRRNNLTGTIPDNFPNYCGLRVLDLGTNQIAGLFPKSLANCTELEILNLGNNKITDTFPCFLKNTSTLRVLGMRSNKFYGGIECSKTYGTWPVLQIIDLAQNDFSGGIPGRSLTTWQAMMGNKDDFLSKASVLQFSNVPGRSAVVDFDYDAAITVIGKGSQMDLVKILTIFTLIDFSGNKFNGSIPKEMGELTSLYVLNFSSNAFTGEIPSSLGNLRKLESLDLSQNKLSGQIPAEFTKLAFLSFLNVSNNQLVGRIPTSTQISTFPASSFTGNKGLWGPPLTVDNRAGSSSPPTTLNGSHQNSGDEIDWDLISVEIGFAVGFGIAIGSLVLCKRWSKWYYKAMYHMLLKIFPQLEERIGHHRRHVHINERWRH